MSETEYDIIYPLGSPALRGGTLQRHLRPALVPASWLYRSVAESVRRVRSLDRAPVPDSATVISVGNLEAGGSGKTPLCLHLLEWLRDRGTPCAYVSRGFRSRAERYDGVTVVCAPPPPSVAGTRWLSPQSSRLALEVGDEGAMMARRLGPAVPLGFSRDKSRAVDAVASMVRGGVIVLDDAFQSWNVSRDLDVVLLDPDRPFADGWLLPAGRLREEPSALARADVVVLNGAADTNAADTRARIRRAAGRDIPCTAMKRWVDPGVSAGERVVAASAIARPEAFERSIAAFGVVLKAALRFPDHHHYDMDDVTAMRDACAGRYRCVVTEKDWVKLCELGCTEPEFSVARLEVTVDDMTWWGKQEPRPEGRGSPRGAGSDNPD